MSHLSSVPVWRVFDKVPHQWGGSAVVGRMAGELRVSEGTEFQRRCQPFLSLLLGNMIEVSPQGSLDRAGIDYASYDAHGSLDVVVQCKGFRVTDAEVGDVQLKQCLKSIASFKKSGLRSSTYVFIHNREIKDAAVRDALRDAVADLQASKLVERAYVWTRNQLLSQTVELIFRKCEAAAETISLERMQVSSSLSSGPVRVDVPHTLGTISFQRGRRKVDDGTVMTGNPEQFIEPSGARIKFILGGFGSGKTTLALRTTRELGRHALYLPGARLHAGISGVHQLLEQVSPAQAVLGQLTSADQDELAVLVPIAIAKMLNEPRDDLVLVLDGLDEAPMAFRRGGIAAIVNIIRDFSSVIVIVRDEFWAAKDLEFDVELQALADISASTSVETLTLKPWGLTEIFGLIDAASVKSEKHANNLESLRASLRMAEGRVFHDLLTRPLFITMAIDLAEDHDPIIENRAKLVHAWVNAKIARDIFDPQRHGSTGRPGISAEDEDARTTLGEAHRLGRLAALMMFDTVDGNDEMTGTLSWAKLRQAAGLGVGVDLSTIVTQSLLMPIQTDKQYASGEVQFASGHPGILLGLGSS